mmetsp:Transcript_31526/g.94013  ORF Transcript_31526/g.94013 Transcript_31526/m.94013 type:complete len:216 (+) Transcript_31526:1115-1762(+)
MDTSAISSWSSWRRMRLGQHMAAAPAAPSLALSPSATLKSSHSSLVVSQLRLKLFKRLGTLLLVLVQRCVLHDALHLWDVVHEHVLDATFECDGRRGTAFACASHLDHYHASVPVKAPELDVAAILVDSRSDARLQQLFDHRHYLVFFLILIIAVLAAVRVHRRRAGRKVRGNGVGDGGLERPPGGILLLGYGHKVAAEKDRCHALDGKEPLRQR